MEIRCLPLNGTNCYIIKNADGQAFVIDPAENAAAIKQALKEMGVERYRVIITHAHFDHIMAANELQAEEIFVGKEDLPAMTDASLNFSAMMQTPFVLEGEATPLSNGDAVGCFAVLHTPGHSKGSICLYDEQAGVLFSGDTLFENGVGRTDLYGGSMDALMNSLRKLLALPKGVKVYPGHGPSTTIEAERKRYIA